MFKSTNEAISWIESVKKFGDKLDLSRMELACELLGHPEKELPVIHVAGTNGKGSTVTYLKNILLKQGYNVGTFTSPYIVHFNERITYNSSDILDEELLYYINKVKVLYDHVWETHQEVITFFELVTLISFLFFSDRDIDYVIYEVGLGGRLDATNVVVPMITLITTIGLDHMGVLGDNIQSIAKEKLGIVKDNIPLVSSVTQEELLPLFKTHTNSYNAPYYQLSFDDIKDIKYNQLQSFTYKEKEYKISMIGTHQAYNASLAIETISLMNQLGLTKVSETSVKEGLLHSHWPGRLEQFGNIFLDGAHNVAAANALSETMNTLFKDKKIKVLYTSMADKEYFDIIQIIEKFVHEIYFTEFDYPRCETSDNLYKVSSHQNKFIAKDAIKTLNELKNLKDDEILLITGSLYFVSYIRKQIA